MIIHNKVLFRFTFILSCLLIFPFPLNLSYYFSWPHDQVDAVLHKVIPWFGKHILHLEKDITEFSLGSGDTTYDYVLLLFFVIMALIGTAIWSFLEKKSKEYDQFNYIFEVILRYFLGAMMLSYGLAKIFPPRQFSEPYFFRLLQPYGDSSPMGILWTFMGASQGYTFFSGLMETIGGLLLVHRKTKRVGALILIPVLVNVVALNFFYDVPVKLFSTQLLIFAILIAKPDFGRLYRMLIQNKETPPQTFPKFFTSGKAREWRLVIRGFLLFSIVILQAHITYKKMERAAQRGSSETLPMHGLYEVSRFVINKDTIPATHTDTIGWRYIAFEFPGSVQMHRNNMRRIGFRAEIDTLKKQLEFKNFRDSTDVYTFTYTQNDSIFHFSGFHKQDTLSITAEKRTREDFLLVNRGFHWINERPYNR